MKGDSNTEIAQVCVYGVIAESSRKSTLTSFH
jgi:hypothetical protein